MSCLHEYTVLDSANGWDYRGSPSQPRWTCVRCVHCNVTGPKFDAAADEDASLLAQVGWFGMTGVEEDDWPEATRVRWHARRQWWSPGDLAGDSNYTRARAHRRRSESSLDEG